MEAYLTLIKSYCAINVLLTPKAFKNGGYLLSPIALVMSAIFQCMCAVKLTECGMKIKKCSYVDIAAKALGNKGKKTLEVMLALIQW